MPRVAPASQPAARPAESWIAVQPGTENLVGTAKVFFETYSTFYDFHLGSFTIRNGRPAGNNIVQGYECVSLGTQAMPPSWMNNTDPNVDFDTKGRAYQVTLPFNPWWTNHQLVFTSRTCCTPTHSPAIEPRTTNTSATQRTLTPRRWNRGSCPEIIGAT